jgi:hypothetical protein
MIIQFILCFVLLILAIQDFRLRAVHWILFPLLLMLFIADSLRQVDVKDYISGTAINLLLVSTQGVILFVYYSVQGIKLNQILTTILGLGDILFILLMAFAFSWTSFILFYIAGLVFALFIWIIRILITRNSQGLIPLAGLLAIYIIIITIAGVFIPEISRNSNLLDTLFPYVN